MFTTKTVYVGLQLPPGGRRRRQTLPVHAGGQPSPLIGPERADRLARLRPGETATVQTALRQPDAGAVPYQKLDAVAAFVAEGVGAAVAGRTAQALLHAHRQALDAQAHIDRLDRQPHLLRHEVHASDCINAASQRASTGAGTI